MHKPTGAPWATLFLSALLVLFLGVAFYTSLLFYRTAREVVRDIGTVTFLPVDMPRLGALISRQAPAPPAPPSQNAPANRNANPAAQVVTLPTWQQQPRVNILLMGVDKRPDEAGPPRTDTLMVVSIDPNNGDVSILSLPRDLWVPIPAYNINGKINTAYAIGEARRYPGGGAALAKKTVSDLIGYPVHYYVLVNFDGFKTIIDLIGGIQVCVPKTIHDEKFPTEDYGVETLHIEAGCQHMDGDLALKYARTRHPDSDYGRARRQQQVILAVRDQVLQSKMLPSLIMRAPQILKTLSGSVETDVPLDRMISLAQLAQTMKVGQMRQEVIDNRYGEETYSAGGAWILVPDRERLRPLFDSLFAPSQQNPQEVERIRESLVQAATPTPQPVEALNRAVQAEGARVVIMDGSGRPGLADEVAAWLRDQGFQVVQTGDLSEPRYPYSVMVVHTVYPATRDALMQLFQIRPENVRSSANLLTNVDMELIIGADFTMPQPAAPAGQ